MTDIPYFLE